MQEKSPPRRQWQPCLQLWVDFAASKVMPAIELLRVAGFERISTPEGEVLQRRS